MKPKQIILKTWNETETENLKNKTKQNDDNGLKTSSKKPVAKREWEWSEVRAGWLAAVLLLARIFLFSVGMESSEVGSFVLFFRCCGQETHRNDTEQKCGVFFCEYDKVVAVSDVVAIVFVVVHFWLVVKIL